MAINAISRPPIATAFQAQTRQQESVKTGTDGGAQQADFDYADDQTPAGLQQKLADMADDMASVATQFRNRKDLEQKGGAAGENFERVLEEDAIPKAKKLVEILAVLSSNMDTLLAQARALFPDESDLYLVLKELLKGRELSQIRRARLESLLALVEQTSNSKMLKAGINCALKARLFGASLVLKASYLRQTYRRFLESDHAPIGDYEEWIATYGHKKRQTVLNFVEESLLIDVRSEDPSCDTMEFSDLCARMQTLRIIRTADRDFVIGLLEKKIVLAHPDEEAEWLFLLCGMAKNEKPMSALLDQALSPGCILQTSRERSVLIQSVRNAYKQLPDKLFQNARVSSDAIAAFDRMSDITYTAELLEQRRIAG
ncbi:type III secretion system gatekeeper subunit SctW [Glaciimonas immobilis]|uniref:Type III secretion protein W n=1 Tax=Glaciimonas immobilis TaxID=728004 RepID=A0A840RQB6_9BURK|nr:type III secretion system gatekeeper subunit SctW [Glaciimonas immobilis]KAF3999328.1 type III secretion system gatekeeper subunit SctW [Glaciimonas immobilis]MBB5198810.1 type III secretion protein W [Glaciimonas immobilis]